MAIFTYLLINLLRLLHIFAGVFWVGSSFFMVWIFTPSVEAAGDDGRRFQQRFMRDSRFSPALGAAAILTTLSGLLLYWRASAGLNPQWLATRAGIALTIGGLAGLLAALHGGAVLGRHATRLAEIGKAIASAGGPPQPEQVQEIQALQGKIQRGSVISVILMCIALAGMALAQSL
jgi:uncharacterized membrane protein